MSPSPNKRAKYLAPVTVEVVQFRMKFRVSGCAFVLLSVLQLSIADGDQTDRDELILINKKVENFIKQILHLIRNHNKDIRGNVNCIPEDVLDGAMEALKRSIDCVDRVEKDYGWGRISAKTHRKEFLVCFSKAREEVRNRLRNSTQSVCMERPTEKTYEINVTTAMTKTFLIKIKNGVNITTKKIQYSHVEEAAPEGKEEPKMGAVGIFLDDMDAEKKPSTDFWRRPNSPVPDDLYADQRSSNDDDQRGDERDESTVKDEVESGDEQGFYSKTTTTRPVAEDGGGEEDYDYEGI